MDKFDIIAFDIDGTLTESKQPLQPDMAELLCRLMDKSKVAIISGASYKQFEWQFLSNLDCVHFNNLYLLPADGTVMCTYEDGWRCQNDEPLIEEEKVKIREAVNKMLEEVGFHKPEKIYGELVEDRGSQMNFSAFGQEAPVELKEDWDQDSAKRSRMVEVLKKYLPDLSFTIGGTTSIEITRRGIDKAYGLNKLIKHLGISKERMLFIGDKLGEGGNDAPAKLVAGECRSVSGPEETKRLILQLLA